MGAALELDHHWRWQGPRICYQLLVELRHQTLHILRGVNAVPFVQRVIAQSMQSFACSPVPRLKMISPGSSNGSPNSLLPFDNLSGRNLAKGLQLHQNRDKASAVFLPPSQGDIRPLGNFGPEGEERLVRRHQGEILRSEDISGILRQHLRKRAKVGSASNNKSIGPIFVQVATDEALAGHGHQVERGDIEHVGLKLTFRMMRCSKEVAISVAR